MKKWLEKLFGTFFPPVEEEPVDPVIKQKEDFLAFDGKLEVIIVSDNHEAKEGLQDVLHQHPNADYYFHCGDSNLSSDLDLMKPFITVSGNTDYDYDYHDNEWCVLSSGDRIWMTHGHAYSVNRSTEGLVESAIPDAELVIPIKYRTARTSIILYGHTHLVDVKMEKGLLIINPGSIALPRGGTFIRSYARLEITPEVYKIQIKNAKDHTIVEEFQFPREWRQPDRAPE